MALARVTRPAAYPPPDRGRMLMAREAPTPAAPKPKLLDRVREVLRTRHYSRRTESHIAWIRRYIFFQVRRTTTQSREVIVIGPDHWDRLGNND